MAFTSRSVNLSWAPPFNAEEVGVTKYLIEVRAGEDTPWSDSSIVTTPDNVTLYQVRKKFFAKWLEGGKTYFCSRLTPY